MSPIFITLFIAFIVHLNLISAQPEIELHRRCGRNAVWSLCAGCPSSCEGLTNPNPIMCPAVCHEGCACLPGYIRRFDSSPDCMLEKYCPNLPNKGSTERPPQIEGPGHCAPNSFWSRCASMCPASCDDLDLIRPRRCPAVCVDGCVCNYGYVRRSRTNSTCILETNCLLTDRTNLETNVEKAQRCGRHAEWSECAPYCPPNCESLKNPIHVKCPSICVQGCACLPGYIKISRTDANCILRRDCPYIKDGKE